MIIDDDSDSNQFFLKIQKKQTELRQFSFPSTQAIFQQLSSIKQFMHILNTNQNPEHCKLFKCRILQKKYGYMQCRFCSSYIRFKKRQSQKIEVSGYNNVHIHSSNEFKKNQQLQILQFIDSHQGNSVCLKDLIMQKFNISQRRFYYIMNKAEKNIEFKQLLWQLDNKGYDYLIEDNQNDSYPSIFLYSTPDMGKMYRRFGDVCTFDITYNIIKQRSSDKRQWGVGVFTGLDTNMRILIFAVVLISNESTNSMEKLFEGFFKLYHKQPGVIITDQQLSIISALKKMKQKGIFVGEHLLDTFHILKNIRKRVDKKEFLIYKKLIRVRNKQIFQQTINSGQYQIQDEERFNDFIQEKAKFCCFSMIPQIFIGRSASNSRNQKLNDLIKGFIPRQIHWSTFFLRMDKVVSHIHKNANKKQTQTKPFQSLFKDYGIAGVRVRVQKKIFNAFLSSYVRALRANCEKMSQDRYVFWNAKQQWIVQEDICDCGVHQKSGIPCQHVLRVSWTKNKQNYLDLFNKRWLLDEEVKKEQRGRSRNSRKNLIK